MNYTQIAGSSTLTVNSSGAQVNGAQVYLTFITGGGANGLYPVTYPDPTHFAVTMPDTVGRAGSVAISQVSAGYSIKNSGSPATATITVGTFANHNLQANDHVWLHFFPASGSLNADAEFVVSSIVDEDHFTIVVSNPSNTIKSETLNSLTVYMLVAPPLSRSGTVQFQTSTYNVGLSGSDLLMTPLNAPTVFNFYYPSFQYPGSLSAANVTTPEFQLTTDTNVITLTNTLAAAFLASNNANGLTSYRNNGTITMDLSPYMTPTQTANAGISALVDQLDNLLTGGQSTPATKTTIVNFVANTTNFPYTTPTTAQMRDRVRAIVHLIITSPEYAIQR